MADLYEKGEIKVELKEGKICLLYDGKGGDIELKLEVDYFMDKLKEAIPGEIDDAVIELLKGALKVM